MAMKKPQQNQTKIDSTLTASNMMTSQSPDKNQDDDNQENEPDAARRVVTVAVIVKAQLRQASD
jgi:hypothetical protein